ncbi:MAG: SIR2 family protein, partial [Christensenellaceae bacterium]|nr:SIR2 family protein [Christensenellaceae bacterium]
MTFDELMGCYYVNELDSNKAVYDELVKKLKRHNLTPIIGAGLSCWAYPLWGKLLTDMAKGTGLEDEVDNLLKEYKYEDAASLIEEEYGKKRFLDFLRKKFDPEIARKKSSKRPQYQELIPQIFRGAIITTNFDHAIEHLFELNDMEQPMLLLPHQCERIEQELRAQGSVLVKLHGDVNYWQELVLTKDAYNKTYGDNPLEPDMNKPMPEALAKILKHNPALFLGCSLNTDRTYHVIKSCADSGVNFALLSLPDETENEAEPYKPHLRDDGKLKSVLRSRINELYETLRIKVIWYPCGNHHTEALSAFFSKLAEDIGVTRSTIGEDDRYTPLHTLLGRDDVVKDIADKLSGSVPTCAWVWGTGGIGKTEVCRAVRAKLKDFEMPYIDITEVDNLPAFYQTVADETGISIDGIGIKETGQYLKERLIEKYANSSHRCALYFDNWEDIWYGSENRNEDDELIKWMKSLIANKVRLLVSSREDAPNLPSASVKPFEIKELDGLNSRKLFCEVLGRDIAESERETFDYLIKQLEDHPLAIVLTASQAHDEDIHLDYIKNRWENAEQDIPGGHEQHKNLAIAMQMSWNAIKDNRAAVIQWGLHYYSVGAIPYDVLQELRGDIADEIWRKGSKLLRKASLTNTGSERKSVSMLLPVKKQFDKLIKSDKQIQEDCLIRWAKYIEKLLDSSNELSSADRMIQHQLAVDLAPQIFYVMKQLMTYEASSAHQYLNSIVLKARNYYQFSIESVTLLEELKSYYKEHSSSLIYATVLEDYGDLLRRLGDVDGAKEAYDSAEP